jgi:hypothetical protein
MTEIMFTAFECSPFHNVLTLSGIFVYEAYLLVFLVFSWAILRVLNIRYQLRTCKTSTVQPVYNDHLVLSQLLLQYLINDILW